MARAMDSTPRSWLEVVLHAVLGELALDASSRGRPCRCRWGQPPWIMKPGMTAVEDQAVIEALLAPG